jgi:hypothetical protein
LPVRLLKDPEFDHWARKEGLTDQMLRAAADEIERALVLDDLQVAAFAGGFDAEEHGRLRMTPLA